MLTPRQLQLRYQQGENISNLLRTENDIDYNSENIIEVAYDLQTGSYINAMSDDTVAEYKAHYTAEIAKVISSYCEPETILEAGVGEATTLSGVLENTKNSVLGFGFDISWSRVAFARNWLISNGLNDVRLCTGSLFNIPFTDNSIDVVYTSHSIEPNGGNELPILKELYRVTRKYLILLEPGFELANDKARDRMAKHGYCKNLPGISKNLGFKIIDHRLFPHCANPLNPTAITIIKKCESEAKPEHFFACPKYKTPLKTSGGMMFSEEALTVYPIVCGIPCLRIENGIMASKYLDVVSSAALGM